MFYNIWTCLYSKNPTRDAMIELLESMVWANILNSCRFQGDVSLGERIADSLIHMEPQNLAYYRSLLNVYDVAGRLENAAKVKDMVKEISVVRMPGCNLVDLEDIVHNLRVKKHWQECMEKAKTVLDRGGK